MNRIAEASPRGPARIGRLPWVRLATQRSIVRRAATVATVVGAILVAINHGDALWHGDVSVGRVLRILLTVFVPYCVSTYSSVEALRGQSQKEHQTLP